MKLHEFVPGERGRITKILPGSHEYRRRLLSMGALPGTEFEVSRVAPLGDPVEIKIRGSFLSVRKAEINVLEVEKI